MKKVLILLAGLALVLVVGLGVFLGVLAARKPASRPPSTETVERTPARLARGRYLVENLCDCFGCHSERIAEKYGMPEKPGGKGKGGFVFDAQLGFPGRVAAQNLTPDEETGLGRWTDGEILRAVREGIDKHGDVVFPMMPYPYFRSLADEDARSIVAYLRTIPPIRNKVPERRIDFPVNLFIKSVPRPVEGVVTAPDDAKDHLAYGKYLVTVSGCRECHTPHDGKGQVVPGKDFTGGWEMKGPWGRVITANLTPLPDVFMGQAKKEEFVGRFKAFATMNAENAPTAPLGRNTVMPWLAYSGLTEQDLGAIYDYLKGLAPAGVRVNPFPDAK